MCFILTIKAKNNNKNRQVISGKGNWASITARLGINHRPIEH
jgi:hypothetical protein